VRAQHITTGRYNRKENTQLNSKQGVSFQAMADILDGGADKACCRHPGENEMQAFLHRQSFSNALQLKSRPYSSNPGPIV
jgi:hypothetical protein